MSCDCRAVAKARVVDGNSFSIIDVYSSESAMIAARNACTARAIACCSVRVILLLTVLSLALAGVIEVPHDPDYTTPSSAKLLQTANCSALFSNVEVDHPSNPSPRAESRRLLTATLMRNSKTHEEELAIGRILLTTPSFFPQSSSSDNQTIFDVEAAAQMIGHIDVIFCYRLSKTPLNPSSPPAGADFSCLHELKHSNRFTFHPRQFFVMLSADLVLVRSQMNLQPREIYEFHIFAESAESCPAVSPATYFQLADNEPLAQQPAIPPAKSIPSYDPMNAASPVFYMHYPQHGSVIYRDLVRSIISFNDTDGVSHAPNPASCLFLSGIAQEDAVYSVVLNHRLLKSFHAKNVIFESGMGLPRSFIPHFPF